MYEYIQMHDGFYAYELVEQRVSFLWIASASFRIEHEGRESRDDVNTRWSLSIRFGVFLYFFFRCFEQRTEN